MEIRETRETEGVTQKSNGWTPTRARDRPRVKKGERVGETARERERERARQREEERVVGGSRKGKTAARGTTETEAREKDKCERHVPVLREFCPR